MNHSKYSVEASIHTTGNFEKVARKRHRLCFKTFSQCFSYKYVKVVKKEEGGVLELLRMCFGFTTFALFLVKDIASIL